MTTRTLWIGTLGALGLILVSVNTVFAAVITVDTFKDAAPSPGECTLREAITSANTDTSVGSCTAGSGDDEIQFSVTLGFIRLGSDLPLVSANLVINGNATIRVSGEGMHRPFQFNFNLGLFVIRNLQIVNGNTVNSGGCILAAMFSELLIENVTFRNCHADGSGGAISGGDDENTLEIRRSTFEDNSSGIGGGAVSKAGGFLYVKDSTFTRNSAIGSGNAHGGAVFMSNLTGGTIWRSTFFDNQATGTGGAVRISNIAFPGLFHNTIVGNTADSDQNETGNGGGVYMQSGQLGMRNNVVAGNFDLSTVIIHPDLSLGGGTTIDHDGNNFIGNNLGVLPQFPEGYPNGDDNYVGTADNPLDPMLEDFGEYGGFIDTMPPKMESPLVDLGLCPSEVADQRGFSNPGTGLRIFDNPPDNANDGCDIGSIELAPFDLSVLFEDGFED